MTQTAASRTGKGIALALVVGWSIIPIAVAIANSFKIDRDIFQIPPRLWFSPTLQNYVSLWRRWKEFFGALENSVIIVGGALVLTVVVSTFAGYAYSRYRGRALDVSMALLILMLLIPPIVITIPLFPAANFFRINDTHFLLIILYAAGFVSLSTLIMRSFFDQIPKELDEAALVDGASRGQVVWKIIFPLSAQGMIAVAVFVIIFAWNDYTFAFIFTATRAKTAPLVLGDMIGALDGIEWGVLFAATTIQLVPIVVFVILAQRYLIAGLTAGAVKG